MFGLFSFLRWSFEAMAQRRYPSERHDRKPWHETDSSRKHLAGENLGYCASFLFIKGDWSEFVSSFGFASWATHRAPCFLCRATNLNLHDLEGYSEVGMPHGARTHEEWDIACSVCEIDKDLLPSEVITVRSKLRYKGKKGKARHLIEDVPALGLKKNDRVEPTSSSPDIASIDTAPAGAGFRVRFWRSANERFVRHRNPLFDAGLGITVRSLVADWLHCLSLGVFEVFCAHFMRAIFDTGIWGSDSDPSVQISFARSELTGWYTRESAAGRTYTRVQYMNVYTFGTAKEPQLNLSRAAEVNGFLEFCLYLVVEKSECLGLKASLWRRGLETLVGILHLVRDRDALHHDANILKFVNYVIVHHRCCEQLSVPLKPKHHMLQEIGAYLRFSGPPALHACWTDESDNFQLRQMAEKVSHWSRWHLRVLGLWKGNNEVKRQRRF